MKAGKTKRRETSRLVRRLLQLIIHARDYGDLDKSDSSRSTNKQLDSDLLRKLFIFK